MAQYEVIVSRVSYASKTIEVEAATQEEAKALALEAAYNEVFQEHNADYEVQLCVEGQIFQNN
jgi:hypothetical protein